MLIVTWNGEKERVLILDPPHTLSSQKRNYRSDSKTRTRANFCFIFASQADVQVKIVQVLSFASSLKKSKKDDHYMLKQILP